MSILNWLSSFHGTQSLPVAHRVKLDVTSRPAWSRARIVTMYEPPPGGVKRQETGSSAETRGQRATVSDTHSPTTSPYPSRSRWVWFHSRRTTVPCTDTPVSFVPSGRTAMTLTLTGFPAVQK